MNRIELQGAFPVAQIAARLRRSFDLEAGASAVAHGWPAVPASWFVGLSILCVLALAAAGALSSRDCRVEPVVLEGGLDHDVSISVPTGRPCPILVRVGNVTLDGLSIDEAPQYGTLTPRGRTGVVYRPDRAFSGDDTFVFSLHGRSSSTVRVRASVDQADR